MKSRREIETSQAGHVDERSQETGEKKEGQTCGEEKTQKSKGFYWKRDSFTTTRRKRDKHNPELKMWKIRRIHKEERAAHLTFPENEGLEKRVGEWRGGENMEKIEETQTQPYIQKPFARV